MPLFFFWRGVVFLKGLIETPEPIIQRLSTSPTDCIALVLSHFASPIIYRAASINCCYDLFRFYHPQSCHKSDGELSHSVIVLIISTIQLQINHILLSVSNRVSINGDSTTCTRYSSKVLTQHFRHHPKVES